MVLAFAGYILMYIPYVCVHTCECTCSHKSTGVFFPFSEVGWHVGKHMASERSKFKSHFHPVKTISWCSYFIQPLGTLFSHD